MTANGSNRPGRTLLVAPPSLSSKPDVLNRVVESYDRATTDLQMLDRLALGLASLPASTYELILLLTDADGAQRESESLFGREVLSRLVTALQPGGKLRSESDGLGRSEAVKTEAVLAGLLYAEPGEFIKPDHGESEPVPLSLKKRSGKTTLTDAPPDDINSNGKRKAVSTEPAKPNGVGFVDFSDDLEAQLVTGEDDELIDEDTLLTEEDLTRPVVQPPECRPKAGKRRRACKDCTCGMKEKLEAEDAAKRSTAETTLSALKLGADDLTEVDFTVQGKVGSCGNCALGDAFRCDGCPYIGLPAFKPGEEVRLLNNDVQL